MHSSDLSNLSVEPSAIRQLTDEQKERLSEILDRYLSAIEQGAPLNSEKLKEENVDLAEQLQLYFERLDQLHEISAGFQNRESQGAFENGESRLASNEKRLGDFILGKEIGRGGMGVVYDAQQISLGRRVALKVLPFAAVLDSKQIARFKNEAKAAAQLLHPNIVPVFAVGSERGVHYYAMQFIDGQPLDRAIAELRECRNSRTEIAPRETSRTGRSRAGAASKKNVAKQGATTASTVPQAGARPFLSRNTSNRQDFFQAVMRLGIQAAEALHAAHEFGVIHRDIKPSNLLLDQDGKLWVTDFGLARIQNDATLSRTGDVVGTMRYMSPEQAHGQSAMVDHRSDVYSLGATLFELLALRPVFLDDDRQVLLRQIDQHEPPRLSQLCPGIPIDLETVVMKAMSKLREDRYATAQALADDLRRVLEGKPTLAKPPSMTDRLTKFARRHRRIVSAAAIVSALFLVTSSVAMVVIYREKDRAERNFLRADRNFQDARSAVDRFGAQLAERLADVPGAQQVRRDLLRQTLSYYQRFVEQARDVPGVRADLAMTFNKIGTLADELGSTQEAISAHENAARLYRELSAENAHSNDYRQRLGVCQNNLGMVLGHAGRVEDARKSYQAAIEIQEWLVKQDSSNLQFLGDLALSYGNLGLLQSESGDTKAAEESLREAIRWQQKIVDLEPTQPEPMRTLAASLNNLSALLTGELTAKGIEIAEQALAYQIQASTIRPTELKYQSDIALTHNNIGAAQVRLGKLMDAERSYGEAIAIQERLLLAAPSQQSYQRDLAVSFNNLGRMQSQIHRSSEAEKSFRTALSIQLPLVLQHPDDVGLQSSVGGVYNNLGIVLEELQRQDDAAESYKQAIKYQRLAYSQAADVARYRQFLSKHYFNYGRVLRRRGDLDQAVEAALERRELWRNDPQRLLTVAEELAESAQLLEKEKTSSNVTVEKCSALAVDVLQEAVNLGLKLPQNCGQTGPFSVLRNDVRFKALLADSD